MKFNFSFDGKGDDKWQEFNEFLSNLAGKYPDEFKKEMYADHTFMIVGYKSSQNDIGYNIDDSVPEDIQTEIISKLRFLFPKG